MGRLTVVLAACALAGCAESAYCIADAYRPLVVPVAASRFALLEAAERHAHALGASRVELAADRFEVGAVIEAKGEGLRDRIVIALPERGSLEVSVRTEMDDGHGGWISAPGMCKDYQHNRERRIADHILAQVVPHDD